MQTVSLKSINTGHYALQEAFKSLRTNIGFCDADICTIAVTSTHPNEGKSEVALRLAYAFAETGAKTLLLDADIRNSVLPGKLQAGRIPCGLSHILSGKEKTLSDAIYVTDVANLDILFTGAAAPNPAELLGNERFHLLLKALKKTYTYVIIDCPPVGPVIDAAIVAKECDGTLIVVAQDATKKRDAKKTVEQLRVSGAHILGTVLNKTKRNTSGYGYGYGYDNTAQQAPQNETA